MELNFDKDIREQLDNAESIFKDIVIVAHSQEIINKKLGNKDEGDLVVYYCTPIKILDFMEKLNPLTRDIIESTYPNKDTIYIETKKHWNHFFDIDVVFNWNE